MALWKLEGFTVRQGNNIFQGSNAEDEWRFCFFSVGFIYTFYTTIWIKYRVDICVFPQDGHGLAVPIEYLDRGVFLSLSTTRRLIGTSEYSVRNIDTFEHLRTSPYFSNISVKASPIKYMGVSKNRGTPKSSILIGFSIINHPFWGTPIFGNTQINIENL